MVPRLGEMGTVNGPDNSGADKEHFHDGSLPQHYLQR
jgi:hypothetical protein